MARLTKAEKLQEQLDAIRKNCKHPKQTLTKNAVTFESIHVNCRACASNLALRRRERCEECLSSSIKQIGNIKEDIVNQRELTKYRCRNCGHEQIDETEI